MKTIVQVSLTPEQRLEIEGTAQVFGQTLASFLRMSALEKSIQMRPGKLRYSPTPPKTGKPAKPDSYNLPVQPRAVLAEWDPAWGPHPDSPDLKEMED